MFRHRLERWGQRLRAAAQLAAATARAMVGVGDYAAYLRHQRLHHPGATALTREEFFRRCQQRRYRRGALRCC
jgi:uncharacterized short protein YbdD (DUF466 family)